MTHIFQTVPSITLAQASASDGAPHCGHLSEQARVMTFIHQQEISYRPAKSAKRRHLGRCCCLCLCLCHAPNDCLLSE